MYSDEGPSTRSLFRRRRSPSVDLEALEVSLHDEDKVSHETAEPERGDGAAAPPLKSEFCFVHVAFVFNIQKETVELKLNIGRPLTLFDDYEIVGGVPTFVIRRREDDGDHRWDVRSGLSSDGSRLAFAAAPTTVCVYDLLDGCSLVARKEGIANDEIVFLSFWNDCNDKLVVVSRDRRVSFLSVLEDPSTSDGHAITKSGELKELKEEQIFQLDYDFNIDYVKHLDAFTLGSTLWIADREEGVQSLHITCITREDCSTVELHHCLLSSMLSSRIQIGVDIVGIEDLSYDMTHLKRTVLFNAINFRNESVQSKPVVIPGVCLALNGFGDYLLSWKFERDGKSHLNLYSKDPSKYDPSKPSACLKLGSGVLSVTATSLDRQACPFNDMSYGSPHQLPLICVSRHRQSRADLLVWDAYLGRVLTRIDVTIKEAPFGHHERFALSVSSDGKWITILDAFHGMISLFSLLSGVQVWQASLRRPRYIKDRHKTVSFNALNTVLVVSFDPIVYMFYLPCLIKGHKLYHKRLDCEIDFKNEPDLEEEAISIVQEDQLQVAASSALGSRSLLGLCFKRALVSGELFIRVANPFSTSKMAIMIHKDICFSIILASLREICSSKFVNSVSNLLKGRNVEHAFQEIQIQEDLAKQFKSRKGIECIVLYPNKRRNNDCIAICGSDVKFTNAIFIDLDAHTQDFLRFESGLVYVFVQSKDGSKLMCLKKYGILIIDLEQRRIAYEIQYQVNLLHWIYEYHKETGFGITNSNFLFQESSDDDSKEECDSDYLKSAKILSPPQIEKDGNMVLLGWSVKDKKPIFITPTTVNQDLEAFTNDYENMMPCWALDDTFQKFSFIEFDECMKSITSIGTYSNKDNTCKHFRQDEWNPQIARFLEEITNLYKWTCSMMLSENDGYLELSGGLTDETMIVRLTPHSMNQCLPSLYNLDYPSNSYGLEDVAEFVSKFGASFFNMRFDGKTNLHVAIEHADVDMIKVLLSSAHSHDVLLGIYSCQTGSSPGIDNLIEVAIQQNSEDVLRTFLDVYKKQQLPFIYGATAIKGVFPLLWNSSQKVAQEILLDNSLCWDMSSWDVPPDILTNKVYVASCVGTNEDLIFQREGEDEHIIIDRWESSNKETLETISHRVGDMRVKATSKVFCFENTCKTGSEGILRFLLSQRAPAYIFKAPLIKWTVLYKWEHIWKKQSFQMLVQFVFMLGMFTSYVLSIGFYRGRLGNDLACQICISALLISLVLFALAMLSKEMMQLRTYIKDRELFYNDSSSGIRRYLRSSWNVIELLTYVILVFLIAPMHFLSFHYTWHLPFFYIVMAIESIFMWFKVWYFEHTFSETGTLVLLVKNVVRDCVPYLIVSGVVLVGFSIGLFTMFQDVMESSDSTKQDDNKEQDEDETMKKIVASFGTPLKAILTLFYAMLGTIDVEVYSMSGQMSPIIVLFLVLYLSIQGILMFNMLIAIMNDTFDKVQCIEEEQLLLGRARFIDACEASLTESQITRMNEKIGKYLYILLAKDEKVNEESITWQGRIKNIKDSVKKELKQSQARIIEKIEEDIESLETRTKEEIAKSLESLKDDNATALENLEENLKEDIKAEMTAMEERIKVDNSATFEDIKETLKGEGSSNMLAMEERLEKRIDELGASVLEHLKILTETRHST